MCDTRRKTRKILMRARWTRTFAALPVNLSNSVPTIRITQSRENQSYPRRRAPPFWLITMSSRQVSNNRAARKTMLWARMLYLKRLSNEIPAMLTYSNRPKPNSRLSLRSSTSQTPKFRRKWRNRSKTWRNARMQLLVPIMKPLWKKCINSRKDVRPRCWPSWRKRINRSSFLRTAILRRSRLKHLWSSCSKKRGTRSIPRYKASCRIYRRKVRLRQADWPIYRHSTNKSWRSRKLRLSESLTNQSWRRRKMQKMSRKRRSRWLKPRFTRRLLATKNHNSHWP